MERAVLPDKVIKRIRMPVFGYNILKFIIYSVVGIVLGMILYGVLKNVGLSALVIASGVMAGFVMSVFRINGEIDLDSYLISLLRGKEVAVTGSETEKLVPVDGVTKERDMLRVGGSYVVIIEVTGDSVAVMSEDRATWYFDGYTALLQQASVDMIYSIIVLPTRYDPTELIASLRPAGGSFANDMYNEYRTYLEGFRNIRVYHALLAVRMRSSVVGNRLKGENLIASVRTEFQYEIDKVGRILGSKGMSVRLVTGEELMSLGRNLYGGEGIER